MAYVDLTITEVSTGEPTSTTMLNKVKGNFTNHESRITAVETGANTVYPPIIFRVNGPYYLTGATSGILKTTLNFNITITGARLLIDQAGSASTTEIDLKYKRGAGSYTTVFTTPPSVSYTAGNDALSSNAVLNLSEVDLEAGDILALDITSVQTGGVNFLVRIDYNKT